MHPAVLAWLVIGGGVGCLLGARKGQMVNGGIAGVLLGPLGWVLILTVAQSRPRCPECLGWVSTGARKCRHCGERLPVRGRPT
jgi:hypothetical protein